MAKFCTKCGSPIAEGMKFCSKCGTPVQGAVTASSNPQPTQPSYQATAQQTVQSQQQWSYQQAAKPGVNGIIDMFFGTSGRINRKLYVIRYLILCVIATVAILLVETESDVLVGIGVLVLLVLLVSGFLLGIRRLHDLDKSGWFILLYFIPLVNGIFGWYLLLVPGTIGPNRFGPDPIERR